MTKIHTTCSGCMIDLVLTEEKVTAKIPSNGKRGSLHVPAHEVTAEVYGSDPDLPMWDCPVCGYADSYDRTQDEEAVR